jgi:vacuolar-type H+-ATPase subunit E/Vma4
VGRDALLESLRARAAEERAALWAEVRSQADALRAELAQAAAAERERSRATLATLELRLAEASATELRRQQRVLRTEAALRLEQRCRELARSELPGLRDERLFSRLAQELPPLEWRSVEVNPADASRAQALFPDAAVVCLATITGGLNVATRAERVRIENSLETRLEMAWPDLVPQLLASLLPETADVAPAP